MNKGGMNTVNVYSLAERPTIIDVIHEFHNEPWPRFLSQEIMIRTFWRGLYYLYPEYQFVFEEDSDFVGVGNCFPIYWNGEVDGLPRGFDQTIEVILKMRDKPNCLCALSIVLSEIATGNGVGSRIISRLKALAGSKGFDSLVMPVRPVKKADYPSISMEEYITWESDDLPYDPLLRVHVEAGGRILKVAKPSMFVSGTVKQWREWTGMNFEKTGSYEVPGALNPVYIDIERDAGEYMEPNVWILHACSVFHQTSSETAAGIRNNGFNLMISGITGSS